MRYLGWLARGLTAPLIREDEWAFFRKHLQFDIPPVTATMVAVSVVVFYLMQSGEIAMTTILSPDLGVAPLDDVYTYLAMVWHIFGHRDGYHLTQNLLLISLMGKSVDTNYRYSVLVLLIVIAAMLSAYFTYISGARTYGLSIIVSLYMSLSLFSYRRTGEKLSLWGLIVVIMISMLELDGYQHENDGVNYLGHLAGLLVGFGYILGDYLVERVHRRDEILGNPVRPN